MEVFSAAAFLVLLDLLHDASTFLGFRQWDLHDGATCEPGCRV
jgi:hypothetical protein